MGMNLSSAILRVARKNPDFRRALQAELRRMFASEALRPPAGIAAAVHDGKLPAKVLLVWKYVAEKMGDHFSYGGAVAYWRSKCRKEGINLPEEFMKGLGGKGVTANFPHKSGEQIEDWVRECLKSEGLIAEASSTAAEINLTISSIEQKIVETRARIAKHVEGLAQGSRVEQRKKWLVQARAEMLELERQMAESRRGVEAVREAAERHEEHHAPSVVFEEQFQKLLSEALGTMNQQQVIDKVLRSLTEMNAGLKAAESPSKVAIFGDIWGVLEKVWGKMKAVFSGVVGWVRGLFSSANKLNTLLDKAI